MKCKSNVVNSFRCSSFLKKYFSFCFLENGLCIKPAEVGLPETFSNTYKNTCLSRYFDVAGSFIRVKQIIIFLISLAANPVKLLGENSVIQLLNLVIICLDSRQIRDLAYLVLTFECSLKIPFECFPFNLFEQIYFLKTI